jgi:hypothetical protein
MERPIDLVGRVVLDKIIKKTDGHPNRRTWRVVGFKNQTERLQNIPFVNHL